jgi:hypothetical protein
MLLDNVSFRIAIALQFLPQTLVLISSFVFPPLTHYLLQKFSESSQLYNFIHAAAISLHTDSVSAGHTTHLAFSRTFSVISLDAHSAAWTKMLRLKKQNAANNNILYLSDLFILRFVIRKLHYKHHVKQCYYFFNKTSFLIIIS